MEAAAQTKFFGLGVYFFFLFSTQLIRLDAIKFFRDVLGPFTDYESIKQVF